MPIDDKKKKKLIDDWAELENLSRKLENFEKFSDKVDESKLKLEGIETKKDAKQKVSETPEELFKKIKQNIAAGKKKEIEEKDLEKEAAVVEDELFASIEMPELETSEEKEETKKETELITEEETIEEIQPLDIEETGKKNMVEEKKSKTKIERLEIKKKKEIEELKVSAKKEIPEEKAETEELAELEEIPGETEEGGEDFGTIPGLEAGAEEELIDQIDFGGGEVDLGKIPSSEEKFETKKADYKETLFGEPMFHQTDFSLWDKEAQAKESPGVLDNILDFAAAIGEKIPKTHFSANNVRITTVFAAIYLMFGAFIGYLLFFNTGLEIIQTPNPDELINTVQLGNRSVHLIKEIKVSYLTQDQEKELIEEIEEIEPNMEVELDLGEIKERKVQLIVEAKYHQPISEIVELKPTEKQSQLAVNIRAPNVAFVDYETKVEVQVCNFAEKVEPLVQLNEQHNPEIFGENKPVENFSLETGECKPFEFEFKPKKAGQAVIFFNVVAGDTIKKQKIELRVEE